MNGQPGFRHGSTPVRDRRDPSITKTRFGPAEARLAKGEVFEACELLSAAEAALSRLAAACPGAIDIAMRLAGLLELIEGRLAGASAPYDLN